MSIAAPAPDVIRAVHARIASRVRRTPVLETALPLPGGEQPVTLKLELLQRSGSFKARGAFATLAEGAVPPAGVTAASGGNHGAAVALAAREHGTRAAIFVPALAAPAKVERLRRYGAEVHTVPGAYAEALDACRAHAAATGARLVPAFDDDLVIAGQGTLGLELDAQAAIDTVIVAVGGGGLAAGVAAWFGDRVRLVAVETAGTASLDAALTAGAPVDVPISGLAADALGARRIGDRPFALLRGHVTQRVVLDDEALGRAQWCLWEALRVMAEPGGAAAVAALLSGAYVPAPGERVAAIVCGGNVDPATVVALGHAYAHDRSAVERSTPA